ncbi:hypothetical protein JNJ66_00855 [Candidatus Saccharibacteria bacterium]|nr:hypothetical protein [Candidatus Saccharibacteria bacterium]
MCYNSKFKPRTPPGTPGSKAKQPQNPDESEPPMADMQADEAPTFAYDTARESRQFPVPELIHAALIDFGQQGSKILLPGIRGEHLPRSVFGPNYVVLDQDGRAAEVYDEQEFLREHAFVPLHTQPGIGWIRNQLFMGYYLDAPVSWPGTNPPQIVPAGTLVIRRADGSFTTHAPDVATTRFLTPEQVAQLGASSWSVDDYLRWAIDALQRDMLRRLVDQLGVKLPGGPGAGGQ